MRFSVYLPCTILKPFVETIAISEATEEKVYKVLPGTGPVIAFQYRGKVLRVENGEQISLSASGITGMQDTYRVFKNIANTASILVYFKEGGASAFFRQPIHELFGESISLDNFMLRSELLVLEQQLCEAKTDEGRIHVIEKFLIFRLDPVQDNLVISALALIHKTKGSIRIRELADGLHISQSPLEKRFRQVVGISPKKFASIIRLKHTILEYPKYNSLADLGYQAGFYDQAHFIKQFTRHTGESPEAFFSP